MAFRFLLPGKTPGVEFPGIGPNLRVHVHGVYRDEHVGILRKMDAVDRTALGAASVVKKRRRVQPKDFVDDRVDVGGLVKDGLVRRECPFVLLVQLVHLSGDLRLDVGVERQLVEKKAEGGAGRVVAGENEGDGLDEDFVVAQGEVRCHLVARAHHEVEQIVADVFAALPLLDDVPRGVREVLEVKRVVHLAEDRLAERQHGYGERGKKARNGLSGMVRERIVGVRLRLGLDAERRREDDLEGQALKPAVHVDRLVASRGLFNFLY